MKYEKSYCNPLPIPDIPQGKDDWYPYEEKMFSHEIRPKEVTSPSYRSVSDPTVLYENGKWYLYPSYGMAYVSEDFVHWKHIRTQPYCPKYSPAITRWKDGYLLTSWMCPLYYGDNPLGPFTELGQFIMPDGTRFVLYDPAIFTDEDGRLYLYAFSAHGTYGTPSYTTKIIGYELDADSPRHVVNGPVVLFAMNPAEHVWERQGYHNQNTDFGWVEGPHLLKYNGRYYLIYAAPDTRDASYCMAVYYSDVSPLGPFICQKRNPLTLSRTGFVSGAGHGCVEVGPDNTLWAFYTVACPRVHQYERRIGMDRVEVDENGELFCPHGVTEVPQFAPGENRHGSIGYYNLTEKLRPTASSQCPGRDALYATDGSNLSCWVPDENDEKPTLTVEFDDDFLVGAIRLFRTDMNYAPENGIFAGAVRFMLEGFSDGNWKTLLDCTDNTVDYAVDYRVFEEQICSQVRLTITGKPEKLQVGIADFAVFGKKK